MLLRQTFLYLPAQIVGPIVQFVAVIAWTHFLAPEELGLFALITAAQEFIYTGTLFWYSLYTVRHHDSAAEAASTSAFLATEAAVLATASLVALLAVALLPLLIGAEVSPELLAATAFYTITRGIAIQLGERARAGHDAATYSLLQIVWPIAGFALALGLLKSYAPTAAAVLWGYAIAQIATLVLAIPRMSMSLRPMGLSRDTLRAALTYGLPLVIGGLLIWAANNGIRFVLEWKEGAAAVGLVTVGLGLGLRVANVAAMSVTAAAFPLAVKKARESGLSAGQEQLIQNGILLLLVLIPAAVGLVAISRPLIELVVAEPYRAVTAEILSLAVLAGTARNIRIHFGEQVFLLHDETMLPLYNDAVDAALTLGGTVAGLFAYGLTGAIAGAAGGAVLSLVVTLTWGWARHRYAMRMTVVLRIVLAAAVMAAAVWVFDAGPSWIDVLAAIAFGAAVYAGAIALLFPEWRATGLRALGLGSRPQAT